MQHASASDTRSNYKSILKVSSLKRVMTRACLQDYFWTFCSKLWASKDINDGNIEAEAVAGAKAYVEQLRQTGILSA